MRFVGGAAQPVLYDRSAVTEIDGSKDGGEHANIGFRAGYDQGVNMHFPEPAWSSLVANAESWPAARTAREPALAPGARDRVPNGSRIPIFGSTPATCQAPHRS
jgi:hypothetical protein